MVQQCGVSQQQSDKIKHIGPYAQDWYKEIGVGENNVTVNAIDFGGVALACIKELTKRVDALTKEVAELKAAKK